jgi:hypothetical protein
VTVLRIVVFVAAMLSWTLAAFDTKVPKAEINFTALGLMLMSIAVLLMFGDRIF